MSLSETEALVTGALAGILIRYTADPERGVLIDDVTVETDQAGNFKQMLTLTMRSGARLRVIVTEI